jgi:hypothetical protein
MRIDGLVAIVKSCCAEGTRSSLSDKLRKLAAMRAAAEPHPLSPAAYFNFVPSL